MKKIVNNIQKKNEELNMPCNNTVNKEKVKEYFLTSENKRSNTENQEKDSRTVRSS